MYLHISHVANVWSIKLTKSSNIASSSQVWRGFDSLILSSNVSTPQLAYVRVCLMKLCLHRDCAGPLMLICLHSHGRNYFVHSPPCISLTGCWSTSLTPYIGSACIVPVLSYGFATLLLQRFTETRCLHLLSSVAHLCIVGRIACRVTVVAEDKHMLSEMILHRYFTSVRKDDIPSSARCSFKKFIRLPNSLRFVTQASYLCDTELEILDWNFLFPELCIYPSCDGARKNMTYSAI